MVGLLFDPEFLATTVTFSPVARVSFSLHPPVLRAMGAKKISF